MNCPYQPLSFLDRRRVGGRGKFQTAPAEGEAIPTLAALREGKLEIALRSSVAAEKEKRFADL
jgi:hypothetical protein